MKLLNALLICLWALLAAGCQAEAQRATSLPPILSEPASSAELQAVVWRVTRIGDSPVVQNSPARIQFSDNGKVNGNASCNRFFGEYEHAQGKLRLLGPPGATKMMCLPHLMTQETQVLESLIQVDRAEVKAGQLLLLDEADRVLLRAVPDQSS
ncbi:META domain-containing protein [Marinimicrobium alkaliphilum]|uniref:META domain-containing protein n=1 Tax=Marinimicrobium alkaliphilum TaxID=2202654 RepID=UPI000DB90D32|nr:META domain-containing protein [Marinimicrobium alkaliphilum]